MNRRAQAAIEFLILFGFMLLVFTVAYLIIQERSASRNEQAGVRELEAIGQVILQEVRLASRVHDGYNRTFNLPLLVSRGTYTITLAPDIEPSEVTLNDSETEFVVFLPVNLTTGSVFVPGPNFISRANGTLTAGVSNPPVCVNYDRDNFGSTGSTGVEECGVPNTDCDDTDPTSYPENPAAPDCGRPDADQDCDGIVNSEEGACLVCTEPTTNIVYFAGGTTLSDGGTVWTERNENPYPIGGEENCCDPDTHCAITGVVDGCVPYGWVGTGYTGGTTSREWVCDKRMNDGVPAEGPALYRCTIENDGRLLPNSTGAGYCCSIFTGGASTVIGKRGFSMGLGPNNNKRDDITVAGSCSDLSDNDCDGKKDQYDDLCWNALVNSTCLGNSVYENLTAHPNSTMPSTTRFAYDWRVNGASILVAQYLFDVNMSSGLNTTKDYSQGMRNATEGANTDDTRPEWKQADWYPTLNRGSGSGAFYFRGGRYLNLTTTEPTGAYTIEAWVLSDAVNQNRSIIVRTSSGGPTVSWSHQLRYVRYTDSVPQEYRFEHYAWDQYGSGSIVKVLGTTVIAPNTWYHVVGTGAPGGKLRLFVNGVEEGTPAPITTPWTTGANAWLIGPATGGSMGPFRGYIDEVRIYNRNLTPEQVRANYLMNGFNRTVAKELAAGQSWQAVIYPNNGTHDGLPITSNAITTVSGPDACTPCAGCLVGGTCYAINDAVTSCTYCRAANDIANRPSEYACSDGAYCNGAETCDGNGVCTDRTDPCGGERPFCNEANDRCDQCTVNADCTSQCWYNYTYSPILGDRHAIEYGATGTCSATTGSCSYTLANQAVCYGSDGNPKPLNYTELRPATQFSDWCREAGSPQVGCCGSMSFQCPGIDIELP